MKMNYVGIRVMDLERSMKFYIEVLDLKEVKSGDMTEHGRGLWVLLQDETTGEKLELYWYPKGSLFDVAYVAGEGVDHIGFEVEDVLYSYEELISNGAEPTGVGPKETDGGRRTSKILTVTGSNSTCEAMSTIPGEIQSRTRRHRLKRHG